ncbi:arginine biosynthesis protein ArgJ [Mrakia frigida]|uniref:glutamate N-acetyltransferase n=1 Tax=Mrakia frigida TaxID=29902 RepID=UPI003FCBF893
MSSLRLSLHRSPLLAQLARRSYATPPPPPSALIDKSYLVQHYPPSSFPKGFSCSSLYSGIKKNPLALDMGLFHSSHSSSTPCAAAGTFTKNAFKASPVDVSISVLQSTQGRASTLIVNSGCANAVTGSQGRKDTDQIVSEVNQLVGGGGGKEDQTLIVSTGVIGQLLPMEKVLPSLPILHSTLDSTPEAWLGLAKAFMTTDTFPKLRTKTIHLPNANVDVRIAGIDKGAGMIHPHMGPPSTASSSSSGGPLHGTLLGLIATDAAVEPEALQKALTFAVDRSFNAISVDGDMSTNDTVVAFANGASGMERELVEGEEDWVVFRDGLTEFAEELAKLVVRDGEGATKFVTVTVKGAPSYDQAKAIAAQVSTSSLVKTAFYGEDANWGRILCAIGGVSSPSFPVLSLSHLRVAFLPADGSPELLLLLKGEPVPFSEDRASEILAMGDLEVVVDVGAGEEEARYWTCDFSHEYVTINGSYRS